jgi:DNA primase
MRKFRDLDEVREAIKAKMSLDQVIEIIDGRQSLERVNDHLFKKRCDMNEHPMDTDGSRDSTASFTVCPPKELWYCFGCGTRGDRFEYASRKKNLDHIEAIHYVAELEGFDLSPYYADVTPQEAITDSLFHENDMARTTAHEALARNPVAMNYLLQRGISVESIDKFKLGYAPPMQGDRVDMFDSIPNSIALQLDRKDQFNDAILFPITDVHGRMRYFQSRPFKPITGMKYIGGRDSHPLYEETDRIFGFSIAKNMIRAFHGTMVGVEGAPDTIALIQNDIPAGGFLGTVANQNTFDLLDKYRVTELVLLLDGDKAGRDRSTKISEKYLELKTSVKLKVAMLPDGYDPDEYINKYGKDELIRIIESAPYAVQYLVDRKWDEIQPSSPTGKIDFLYAVQNYVNGIQDKMVRAIMISHIASKMGFDPVQVDDYYAQAAMNSSGIKLFSPDGEEILLGEAMRDPDFISELSVRFKDDDWYLLRHKHLFRILRNSEYRDIESLFTIAKNMGVDNIITYDWLEYLYKKEGNVQFSLDDVEDKLIRRKTVALMDKTKMAAMDMARDVVISLDGSMNDMYNVMHNRADEQTFDAEHQVDSVMALIHERMKNPGQIIGYSLGPGFQKITQALLGIQTKTLTVIAANQTVGKTQLGENWAMYQSVVESIPTGWLSLEMDCDRMTFRHLSILSKVPCTDLMTGNITIEQKELVDNMAISLRSSPFYLSERGHDLSEALAIARRWVIKDKVKVIYIDYAQLQYVTDRRTDARHRELGWISKAWKQFAKEMDVAVILISQLNKEALQADVAKAEHGAGSYEIAQDADNYITLKEKTEEEIQRLGIERGNLIGNLDKNRMGERGILVDLYANRPVHVISEV